MEKDNFVFRQMKPNGPDLSLYLECFNNNIEPKRLLNQLDWMYLENPIANQIPGVIAIPEEKPHYPAAIIGALTHKTYVQGESQLAIQALDTLTDTSFRGKGLFAKLANQLYTESKTNGVNWIFGFPNKNAAHGWFKRFGWKNLDPVPFLIRPLRLKYLVSQFKNKTLTRFIPDIPLIWGKISLPINCELVNIQVFDERFNRLWEKFASQIGVAVNRDASYLTWRVSNKPQENYQTFAFLKNDELITFVTFCVKKKHGGRIGYIMEHLHLPGFESASSKILAIALREISSQRADIVLAWNFSHSPNHICFLKNGFFPMPEIIRPIELHFGVYEFPNTNPLVLDRKQWYLSYLDSDTV